MATTDVYHISGSLTPSRQAVAFIGGDVDDGIQVDAFAVTRTAANDTAGTITAWVNMPDIAGTYTILGLGDANVVEYIHFSVENGKLFAACNDATTMQWDVNSTNVVIKPHQWHHVALVQDATAPTFYVDGYKVARTDTTTTDLAEWITNLDGLDGAHIGAADSIGGLGALTQEFKGAISDVKYWKVALTAAQILDDFNGKAPASITGTAADLTNWWDLQNNLVDSVAAEDGTAVGGIIRTSYSEFTSRLKFEPGAAAVVADVLAVGFDQGRGHAVLVKAA